MRRQSDNDSSSISYVTIDRTNLPLKRTSGRDCASRSRGGGQRVTLDLPLIAVYLRRKSGITWWDLNDETIIRIVRLVDGDRCKSCRDCDLRMGWRLPFP
jgi:hypothetical protein